MNETVVGEEKITPLFFKYAIPSIVGLLLMSIYTIIDGIFVGNFVGPNALASINITLPSIHIMIAISIVLGIGSQSLMGIRLGQGKIDVAQHVFKTGFILVVLIAAIVGAFFILCSKWIVTLLGASPLLAKDAEIFLQVTACFLPLFGGMIVCDFALKTMGRPIYAAMLMLVSVVTNVALDYLFIAKLGWGIRGAAFATGISYTVAFCMAVVPFLKSAKPINLWAGHFQWRLAKAIVYNGSSEGLSEIAAGFTTLLFNITLMSYVGEKGVVAFTIINYINFLGLAVLMGLAEGIGPLVSYHYGSRQFVRIKSILKIACIASCCVGITLFIFLFSYSEQLINMFIGNGTPAIGEVALSGIRLYAMAFLISGLNLVAASYFTALGKPKNAGIIVALRGFIFLLLGIIIMPPLLGITGIWLAVPLAEMLTLFITMILVKKSAKQLAVSNAQGDNQLGSKEEESTALLLSSK